MPRPRKSLDEHKLASTQPKYAEEPALVAGRPKFPKNISGEARKKFKALCAMLQERRHLTNADGELLALYCHAYDRNQKALTKLAEEGEVRVYVRLDSNGQPHDQEKKNLWLDVAQNAEKTMLACLDRLGLTPLNRAKVKETTPNRKKELVPGSMAYLEAQAAAEAKTKTPEPAEPSMEEMLADVDPDSVLQ